MLRLFFLTTLISSLIACSNESTRDRNLNIVISDYDAYQFDLTKMKLTIFNDSKPSQIVKFNLSTKEKNEIIKSYYKFGLNEMNEINQLTGTTLVEDECFIAPKFTTTIAVKSGEINQKIEIDRNCDNFYISNFHRAKRVKAFLKVVDEILNSKPEIKNAPRTDKIYE